MSLSVDGAEDTLMAQYAATKVTWWGPTRCILVVTTSHLAMYNVDTFVMTEQWLLSTIRRIEIVPDPFQFVVMIERDRFRTVNIRFHCHARSHLLALLHTVRHQNTLYPLREHVTSGGGVRYQYQCTEHFANDTYSRCLLHVEDTQILLLDEYGDNIARFPFEYLQHAVASSTLPDVLSLATMYEERLFLCEERDKCLQQIATAAEALGIQRLTSTSERIPLDTQLLRLRNSKLLSPTAVVRFNVHYIMHTQEERVHTHPLQLILQAHALVEVHGASRVISRPYSALLRIVRLDLNADGPEASIMLQFAYEETLVFSTPDQDQLIAILLLLCREAGHTSVQLCATTIDSSRLYYPHLITQHDMDTTCDFMESYYLRRILYAALAGGLYLDFREKKSSSARSWMRRKARKTMRRRRELPESRRYVLMDDQDVSLEVAMEELATNVLPTGFLRYRSSNTEESVELIQDVHVVLIKHLIALVTDLSQSTMSSTEDIMTTLLCLLRVTQSPWTYIPDSLIQPLMENTFNVLIERQDHVTIYHVLRLLQCYTTAPSRTRAPQKGAKTAQWTIARMSRVRTLQFLVWTPGLLFRIVDLVPVESYHSHTFVRPTDEHRDTIDITNASFPSTLKCNEEGQLDKTINIVVYQALTLIYHIVLYLRAIDESQGFLTSNRSSKSTLIVEATALLRGQLVGRLLSKYQFLMDAVIDIRFPLLCDTLTALILFIVESGEHMTSLSSNSIQDEMYHKSNVQGLLSIVAECDRSSMNSRKEMESKQWNIARMSFVASIKNDVHVQEQLRVLRSFLKKYEADRTSSIADRASILFPRTQRHTSVISTIPWYQALVFTKKVEDVDKRRKNQVDSLFQMSALNYNWKPLLTPPEDDVSVIEPEKEPLVLDDPWAADDESVKSFVRERRRGPSSWQSLTDSSTGGSIHEEHYLRDNKSRRTKKYDRSRHKSSARREYRDLSSDVEQHKMKKQYSNLKECRSKRRHQRSTRYDGSPTSSDLSVNDACILCTENETQGYTIEQPMQRAYSSCEVKRHQSASSYWVVVHGAVYDITTLLQFKSQIHKLQTLLDSVRHSGEHDSGQLDVAAKNLLAKYYLGPYYECKP